jgi:hypothetical protein
VLRIVGQQVDDGREAAETLAKLRLTALVTPPALRLGGSACRAGELDGEVGSFDADTAADEPLAWEPPRLRPTRALAATRRADVVSAQTHALSSRYGAAHAS